MNAEQIAAVMKMVHLDTLNRLASGQRLGPATRAHDHVRQRLRQLGLIAYCGKPKRWQISALGLEVLAILEKQP
jgi:hypothetical protein